MKKLIALILALLCVLAAFAGCAGEVSTETDAPTDAGDVTSAEITTSEITTAEQTTAEITTDEVTTAKVLSAEEQFRYDNYAANTIPACKTSTASLRAFSLSDKLLDSVNPGVLALLSECMYFEATLRQGCKDGQKWVYSNNSTYVPQSGTFESMLKSRKYGANCAMPQAWMFIDFGIVTNGKHIYGNSSGGMANFDSLGKYIGAVCTMTEWDGKVKFKDLYTQGKVMPGDIFLASGHTFIYMGDETFLAAGHDGHWHSDTTANTEDSRSAVFDSWIYDMESCTNYTYTVYWQLRFKDEYVPRFYRNAEGELVANPIYSEDKNIEYKQGVSPETPVVIKPLGDDAVRDTSGKVNVLEGIAASKDSGFNMSKVTNGANMTDGKLYYDNKSSSFTDCCMLNGNAAALNPIYYCDANGNTNPTKDETHKYIAGLKFKLKEKATVDSFAFYSQCVGASSNKPFGDIDGFDILVSEDGQNWQVAYSIENATSGGKWTLSNDESNKASTGYYMCHYIRADFDKAYEANYVLFALTSPRTQIAGQEQGTSYSIADTSANYFRISEFQVYQKQ